MVEIATDRKLRRINVINMPEDSFRRHCIAPVDAETGEILDGVVRCEIRQDAYDNLPRLVIEIIKFECNVACGPGVGRREKVE